MSYQFSCIFTLLWASALIFSGLTPFYGADDGLSQWPSLLAVAAGFVVLAAPRSLFALWVSAAIFLVSFAAQMPINPNHRLILFLVAGVIAAKAPSARSLGELSQGIQGSLQWLAIVVYGFATLAKLNTTYFTPGASCAVVYGLETLELYGIVVQDSVKDSSLVALVTVLGEGLLPLALLCRRTRCAAVWLGILFHIGLSLHFVRYFANFSAVMFILLTSFLPEASCERMTRILKPRLYIAGRVWAGALVLLIAAAILTLISPLEYVIARYALYMLFAVSLAVLALYGVWGVRCDARVGSPSQLILAFAVINACTPYLGIKTRSALTMYSNLRIEPGFSNHFFMPKSSDPFGYLADTVEIAESADPKLEERLGRETRQMPYLSLCAYLACEDSLCGSTNRSGVISYHRRGEFFRHNLDSSLPPDCPGWIARKLLLFGPTGPNSDKVCLW